MPPEQFYELIWETLQQINKKDFHVVAAHSPTEEAIRDLENVTGITLPEDFLRFSQRTNGLCVLAQEDAWPEAKLFDVGPAWTFHRGLVILGIETEKLPEWASIKTAYNSLREIYEVTDVLPLLKIIGDGNHYWGIKQDGSYVEVFDGEATSLECHFTDIYHAEIESLIQRQKDMSELIKKRKSK
ncbi:MULTISPECIES: SMI1/KNR4 family protein [Providencia]|uniref:SMI1/KNR4 family protein n=1 Tax=Providencia TaxID=586 RepID=UPI0008FBB165|nr:MULTISPECIES: SMI1/KNR4 family protein [Providencia]APC11514.1 hypothetical protein RB151_018380 [Providencia rettgeri]AVL74865.1 SMI1/KNR4 family protein [Providencia rettgeri]EKH6494651.1 SMI1/KNR4 family protein [Providencia rettgeri]ELR5051410.1 SMI1/KNR4 family protein [Providencia rettgeri]ELR5153313.1 SMI1/KNR4 family protein [Providencia rettgeri]